MIAAVAILATILTLTAMALLAARAGILTIRLARPPQAKTTKGDQ